MSNKIMKICSTSLVLKKMQITATMWYHFIAETAVITMSNNNCEEVEKLEFSSYIAGEHVKWCSHFKNGLAVTQKLNIGF